jgi:hypothetical protein
LDTGPVTVNPFQPIASVIIEVWVVATICVFFKSEMINLEFGKESEELGQEAAR